MDADGVRRLGRHFADEVQRELPVGLLPAGDSASYLRPSGVNWLWRSTFPPRLTSVSPVLPMNRLVTCNLSLVTGDLRMLFPIVTLFSISSYQLPVTSYKSKRFLVPMRDHQTVEATQEGFFEHGLSFTARECAAPAVAPRIWPANDRYSHRRAGAGPGPDWSE